MSVNDVHIKVSAHHDHEEHESEDKSGGHHTTHLPGKNTPLLTTCEHDYKLSSFQLFWDLFYLCLADFIYLFAMIIFQFGVSLTDEHEPNPHPEISLNFQTQNIDSKEGEEGSHEEVPIKWFMLYIAPSVAVLLASVVLLLSQRGNWIVRKCHLFVVVGSLLTGIAGFGVAVSEYAAQFHSSACEEFEGFSYSSLCAVLCVLTFCPLVFRYGFAYAAWKDIKLYAPPARVLPVDTSRFGEQPPLKKWRTTITIMDVIIRGCCMPRFDECQKASEHQAHIYQHIIQLICELILFIVALTEDKHIELLAVIAGILGSVCGLTKLYICDVILNMYALLMGTFLFANSIAHATCTDLLDENKLYWWVYLLLFNVMAGTIRLKSLMSAFVDTRVQIYQWLSSQIDYVTTQYGIASADFDYECFGKIPSFGNLLSFPVKEHHHEAKKDEKKATEKTPLVPKAKKTPLVDSNLTPEERKIKGRMELISILLMIFGLCVLVAAGILMAVLFSPYANAHKVEPMKDWKQISCQIVDREFVWDGHLPSVWIYEVRLNHTTTYYAAVDLWNRYTPTVKDFGDVNYGADYLCFVPSNPLFWTDRHLDAKRKGSDWKRIVILVKKYADFTKYIENYYIAATVYPFGMALGVGMFIGGIAVLCKRPTGLKKNGEKVNLASL